MPLSSCLIVGRFVSVSYDAAADPDTTPESRPIKGLRVTFTPDLEGELLTHATDGVFDIDPAKAITDSQGHLTTLRGERGVRIPATNDPEVSPVDFTYRVTIDTPRGHRIADFHMAAPSGATLDLKTVVPVAKSTGYSINDALEVEQRIIIRAAEIEGTLQQVEQVAADIQTVDDSVDAALLSKTQAEAAALRAETAIAEIEDIPSLVLLFENGLV